MLKLINHWNWTLCLDLEKHLFYLWTCNFKRASLRASTAACKYACKSDVSFQKRKGSDAEAIAETKAFRICNLANRLQSAENSRSLAEISRWRALNGKYQAALPLLVLISASAKLSGSLIFTAVLPHFSLRQAD